MVQEEKDQMDNENYFITTNIQVPSGVTILHAIWKMNSKQGINTKSIKKWKSHLHIYGSRMKKGIHHEKTYAPITSWNSIRFLILLSLVHKWKTVQLVYVLSFSQESVDKQLYTKILEGFEIDSEGNTEDNVFTLHNNVLRKNKEGRVLSQHLTKNTMEELGFTRFAVEKYIFYKRHMIYDLYTEDLIHDGNDQKEIDQIIEDLKRDNLVPTVEGYLQDFLGVKI